MKEALAGPLHLSFEGSRGSTDRTMHVINYPHTLPQTWYSPAAVQLVPLDAAVSAKTVGYTDGDADFAGWVQERGLYFAGEIDPKYTRLIAWNDPGEAPLDGGLIACDHGKGRFVYTGISLF